MKHRELRRLALPFEPRPQSPYSERREPAIRRPHKRQSAVYVIGSRQKQVTDEIWPKPSACSQSCCGDNRSENCGSQTFVPIIKRKPNECSHWYCSDVLLKKTCNHHHQDSRFYRSVGFIAREKPY